MDDFFSSISSKNCNDVLFFSIWWPQVSIISIENSLLLLSVCNIVEKTGSSSPSHKGCKLLLFFYFSAARTDPIFVAASVRLPASSSCQFPPHLSHLCGHCRCEIHKKHCSFLGSSYFVLCDWAELHLFRSHSLISPIKLKTP